MSSPKSPAPQQVVIPLSDPDHVQEVVVTELTGTSVIAGNLHMEFSVLRPSYNSIAPNVAPVTHSRVVAARLVIALPLVSDIAAQLQQVISGMAFNQLINPPVTPTPSSMN